MTTATHLACALCGKTYETGKVCRLCVCGGPLLARYDLDRVRRSWNRDWMRNGPSSIWRYAPVLPVAKPASIVSLGEGMTPLVRAARLGKRFNAQHPDAEQLWIKDEGVNPRGSFHARGASCAVSMAVELGVSKVALASPGDGASGALAAYAASAGIEAHVFMPRGTPQSASTECVALGATVTLVAGGLSDCERALAEQSRRGGWFDMTALREPYGIEGKKTMGYELAEQLNWELPDAVVCPAGSGTAITALWKAFEEMEALGWISSKRPRMIAVQAEGCQPVVRAFESLLKSFPESPLADASGSANVAESVRDLRNHDRKGVEEGALQQGGRSGAARCEPFPNARTLATGLCVPEPLGSALLLAALRASGGTALAVSDAEILDAGLELARAEGILAAPEGAACVAALRKLLASGFLERDQKIVICNTGSGSSHLPLYARRLPRTATTEYDKLGGLITPR
ncbi:MAG: threonine synthase [Bryobacteraceae bacterium]